MPPDRTKGNAPAASTAEASGPQNPQTNESTRKMNSIAVSKKEPAALSLVIAEITILQDEDGRYSLNDLHAASGGAKKHAPNYWMKTQQFKELLAELEAELITGKDVLITGIPAIKTVAGRYGGTYVVKELVYAYSMWISAAFSLRVIRGYDAMMTSGRVHNLSIGLSTTNWLRSVAMGNGIMKTLALCSDMGVAQGQYGTLLQVNRVCGIATLPLERLAPGLRQQLLALEAYDRSEGGAA